MKKLIVSFLCCLLIVSASIALVSATSQLTLTATCDSALYDRNTTLTFSGSMVYNNYEYLQYPSDGLVGIQIVDPTGYTTVIRTLRTGTSMPNNITAYIDSAYLCNVAGNPQTSVLLPTADNGEVPYYYIQVQNNAAIGVPMLLTMNIFDSNGIPITSTYQWVTPGAYSTSFVQTNFNIDSDAHYGIATAYVDVYSNWPSLGGIPYGLEQSFQFTITGGPAFTGNPSMTTSGNGLYSLNYTVPKIANLGTYTVYTTANYLGAPASASTTFQVQQLGDLNGDGKVNFTDLTIFVADYIAYYNSGVYNPLIDLNHDGKVNFADLQAFVHDYIVYWSS